MTKYGGSIPSFQLTQRQFLAHLRNPQRHSAPEGLEERRLQVYRDLIYNNVQGFIRGGFPVLRSILDDEQWHALVREFIDCHPATSPYFLDIGREFLTYLQNQRSDCAEDPAFMLELAHYEWVELALDIAEEIWPENLPQGDLLSAKPVVSPLVWCLSYQFPVHRLGPNYQPEQPPEQPTFLLVYRNADDQVRFMEANAVTHRLIQLLQDENTVSGRSALVQIAAELQSPNPEALVNQGAALLQQLRDRGILCGTHA